MPDLNITIILPSGGARNADIPDDVAIRDLMAELASLLQLPTVGPDGTVFFGSTDYRLYALNPDGSLKWAYKTGWEIHTTPAVDPSGVVYAGSNDKYLYAFNPDGSLNPGESWERRIMWCWPPSPDPSLQSQ